MLLYYSSHVHILVIYSVVLYYDAAGDTSQCALFWCCLCFYSSISSPTLGLDWSLYLYLYLYVHFVTLFFVKTVSHKHSFVRHKLIEKDIRIRVHKTVNDLFNSRYLFMWSLLNSHYFYMLPSAFTVFESFNLYNINCPYYNRTHSAVLSISK